MINVTRMRMLREVHSRGGIAAAAEALYMSPSAVSQQMVALERETGVNLLERSGRGVRLTPAGHKLVAHAERVLAVLEEAQAELATLASGNTAVGPLRICAFPTAARTILVPAVAALRQSHPLLAPIVSDHEPEESIPMLKSGEMNVVLTYEFDQLAPTSTNGIERHLLAAESMYIAMSREHPLAAGPVRIADFADEGWIVGRDGSPFLEVQVRVSNLAGYEPRIDFHSNDYQVILAAVAAGLGVALVPPLAVFAESADVVFRLPEDIRIQRRIAALIRAGSSGHPAISAALDALRSAAPAKSGLGSSS
ncbi:MAG: LysR substrate-binding domain-containing protein [Actinobacteria bacterium]|nr:LysR substrate-binding domain-containing protein [Actinomycetota bacterium]